MARKSRKNIPGSQQCNRPDRDEQTIPGRIVCQISMETEETLEEER